MHERHCTKKIIRGDTIVFEYQIGDRPEDVTIHGCPTDVTHLGFTDSLKSWAVDAWAGRVVEILSGPARAVTEQILSNTSDTITLKFGWRKARPSRQSVYNILVPVDLGVGGWTVNLTLKNNQDDLDVDAVYTTGEEVIPANSESALGRFKAVIPSDDSEDIPEGTYWIDIQLSNANVVPTEVRTVLLGWIVVEEDITDTSP